MVEIPKDVKMAMKDQPSASIVFQNLSYVHQREWINSILETKNSETNPRRINKMIKALLERTK